MQLATDRCVGQSTGHQLEHLPLPGAELVEVDDGAVPGGVAQQGQVVQDEGGLRRHVVDEPLLGHGERGRRGPPDRERADHGAVQGE